MKIIVLGKSGCGKCKAALEKLIRMRLNFNYVALDKGTRPRQRANGVTALAAAVDAGIDFNKELPVIVIDDTAHTYSTAMRTLRKGA